MAMTVTAFAAEDIALWFRTYFANRNEQELSQEQIAYLEENEQVIGQAQTIDGWTVELRSVIHDERMGYHQVIRIEDTDAAPSTTFVNHE